MGVGWCTGSFWFLGNAGVAVLLVGHAYVWVALHAMLLFGYVSNSCFVSPSGPLGLLHLSCLLVLSAGPPAITGGVGEAGIGDGGCRSGIRYSHLVACQGGCAMRVMFCFILVCSF